MFDEVLGRHFNYYPVATEYAESLRVQRNYSLLQEFSRWAGDFFTDTRERAFFSLMSLIADH